MGLSMNSVSPSTVSLFTASGFPTIPSPTICGVLACRGGFLQAAPPLPEGFALHDRLRLFHAGSPTAADRIEFTLPAIAGGRCYGLAVLVPLLSTSCCHDAVTVQYLTILHRMEANFHHFNQTPSQAHVKNRFQRFIPRKTAEAVAITRCLGSTPLKRGVNQSMAAKGFRRAQKLRCALARKRH